VKTRAGGNNIPVPILQLAALKKTGFEIMAFSRKVDR
jgi:hypothetical protein